MKRLSKAAEGVKAEGALGGGPGPGRPPMQKGAIAVGRPKRPRVPKTVSTISVGKSF